MKKPLKIGTRGSPMALVQAQIFADALALRHPALKEAGAIEIVPVTTTGDRSQPLNTPLSAEGGGKALFAKEIQEQLLAGTIDCAVHSMKDLPPDPPEGLEVACILPRDDPRDAFFSPLAPTIMELPEGTIFGTCSPRRAAIVLSMRPDLKIEVMRGNAGTRLKKLEDGLVGATLLGAAGIRRIGLGHLLNDVNVLSPAVMLPASGQGAIGIEVRADDKETHALARSVNCAASELRSIAERAYIREMGGSCRTPLAALMEAPDPEGRARFDVLSAEEDGTNLHRLSYLMSVKHAGDAERLGLHAAREIKAKAAKRSA